ncbi:MAG: aminodeoxychorismate lyase [Gammaproteobacteria bacterium]|nr:aminodeoxychorismate lyase [Gammaproteobacteria bacterium]
MNSRPTTGWVDGRRSAAAWLRNRGLSYGDGVFRTLLKYNLELVDLNDQIRKLCDDARALDLTWPASETLHRAAAACSRALPDAAIKLVLVRCSGGRGYRPLTRTAQLIATADPLPAYPRRCWYRGARAFTASIHLAEQPALAGIKHLNRLEQVLAAAGWPDRADEGILCDMRGAPICGIRSNLFWAADGCLYTPDLSRCGVAGRMRERVLELAQAQKLPVRIMRQSLPALFSADEAFVTNSLIGIWPLRELDHRRWPAPGPITRRLNAALAHPWRG